MADAKKCDRCGGFYQEVEMNPLDSVANAMSQLLTKRTEQKCITTVESFLDLCPACSKSFRRWVKGKEAVGDG